MDGCAEDKETRHERCRGCFLKPQDFLGCLIGEKLESLACNFQEGKRLLVKIAFCFRPRKAAPQTKFGPEAIRRMHHQQTLQQGAEEHASGEAAHCELYTGLCSVSAGHVRTAKVIVGEIRTVEKINVIVLEAEQT